LNLLVFREGRQPVSGSALKTALVQQLRNCTLEQALPALLRAGEAECAVADADASSATALLSDITDALAIALVSGAILPAIPSLLSELQSISFPENLNVSTPEGFAYYALHPLAFADVLEKLTPLPAQAVVVGIRSIGTTLSAVLTATLRMRGCRTERFSVRPVGHPYDRFTEFLPEQIAFVNRGVSCRADFFIVDEGPGISGSSFLSVAEALLRNGVARQNITLICSYEPHVEMLRATNAPERWRQFRCVPAISKPRLPAGTQAEISGGQWRRYFIRDESGWPATWLNFERMKYLSSDTAGPRLFKFLGYGHYGQIVLEREAAVAAAGFGPSPKIEPDGFASYPFISGRPMLAEDLSESGLARMAAYCAFRVQTCRTESADLNALQQMAEHNLAELRFDMPVRLQVERPAIVDGRMQPHEWLLTPDGQMLKTDSGSHGDDHFFPGATDIAWDLAGAIVEWWMNEAEAAAFLKMYHCASGDDARNRIADFITAYTIFRCAWCMMAANALPGTEEQARLEQAAASYGAALTDRVIRDRADIMGGGGL